LHNSSNLGARYKAPHPQYARVADADKRHVSGPGASQEFLRQEADHRLLNSLQMISGLLSMQARSAASGEVSSQLVVASARVAALGRIHQRLHSMDSETDIPLSRI
jgi:two-component sensor histidine kinase